MTEELKDCPFCGGKEVKIFKEGSIWVVECLQCLAKVGATEEAEVLDFWNYRPIENELEAENARLREALTEIKKTVEDAQDTVYPFHLALDSKDGMFILETVENALKEKDE